MTFTVTGSPRKSHPVLGGIAFAGSLATAMLILQNNISDYHTLSSHIQKAALLSPTAPVPSSAHCAILSGELQAKGSVVEPLLRAEIPGTAALWVTEERFNYKMRRMGWHEINTIYSEAPELMIGPYKLTLGFLHENSRIPLSPMELEGQDFVHTLVTNHNYAMSHQYLYTEGISLENTTLVYGDKRFGYLHIPADQPITVLGDVKTTDHGASPLIVPCRELSSTYPAIWPGILGRDEILSFFQTRMINTLLGLDGMIFILSSVLMILAHARSSPENRVSGAGAFMHIFGAGNASILIYSVYPYFMIFFPATFIVYILSSFICRRLFGP